MKFGIKKQDSNAGSDLDIFRRSISDLFDDFFSLKPSGFFDHDWVPAIDVREDNKMIYVKAEMPGMEEKDIDVRIEKGMLTISGEKSEERRENDDKRVIITERKYGSFHRSLRLPEGVKLDGVKAGFKNGVLTIEIPREKPVEPKKLKINVS